MRLTLLAPIRPLILEQSTLGEMKVNLKSLLSWEQNKGLVFITLIEKIIKYFFIYRTTANFPTRVSIILSDSASIC